MEALHGSSMRILSELGIRVMSKRVMRVRESRGKVDRESQTIRIDETLVMEALKTAPSSFTLTSRNPEKQRHVGGNTLTFGLVTGSPNVHDRIKVGAARSIEHARTTATELHMVNVRSAVHIGGSEF